MTHDDAVQLFERASAQRKPLIVVYRHQMLDQEERCTGLPVRSRGEVLYLLLRPGQLKGIPKALLVDVQLLYPGDRREPQADEDDGDG